ncbi:hypothetical protein SBOR_3417 [Sclerotinia borealis F-4128]|uniref:Uncharacterized protein n=1 Tax=Sclerotinia borealis (strain F-4128) TaxID=1432307 RepID=W9CJZ8_SCLBF|nr:hypothetical protein SBOR_3417 [Sclerotinia borealis F-4128]
MQSGLLDTLAPWYADFRKTLPGKTITLEVGWSPGSFSPAARILLAINASKPEGGASPAPRSREGNATSTARAAEGSRSCLLAALMASTALANSILFHSVDHLDKYSTFTPHSYCEGLDSVFLPRYLNLICGQHLVWANKSARDRLFPRRSPLLKT